MIISADSDCEAIEMGGLVGSVYGTLDMQAVYVRGVLQSPDNGNLGTPDTFDIGAMIGNVHAGSSVILSYVYIDVILMDIGLPNLDGIEATQRIKDFLPETKILIFTSRDSEHDVFEAGHSSTSISAALGFLEAKQEFPDKIGDVITVVGDASVTNGLCFEALNYLAAKTNQKMIIIVNDNNMSISKNIGFIAKRYNSLRIKKSMTVLKKITPIRVKHALQYYAYRVDLFTSLGFKYFENIDGHDFKELIKYLNVAKNSSKSIVLHIKTTKYACIWN